jgi:hypothetical protein
LINPPNKRSVDWEALHRAHGFQQKPIAVGLTMASKIGELPVHDQSLPFRAPIMAPEEVWRPKGEPFAD